MFQAVCTKCGKRILVPDGDTDYICPVCGAEMSTRPIKGCNSCAED